MIDRVLNMESLALIVSAISLVVAYKSYYVAKMSRHDSRIADYKSKYDVLRYS